MKIKFRALCSTDDGLEIIYFGQSEFDNGLWFNSQKHIDEYNSPLMQYVGLKDKVGNEIYEGDILECDGSISFYNFYCESGSKRVVINSVCGFIGVRIGSVFDEKMMSSAHIWSNYQLWNISKSLSVIGNIHQNPELIC